MSITDTATTRADPTKRAASAALPPPYDGFSAAYHNWRKARLARFDALEKEGPRWHELGATLDTDDDSAALTALCETLRLDGHALYRWRDNEAPADARAWVKRLNQRLGLLTSDRGILTGDDELSLLEDLSGTPKGRYVPYTRRSLNWHTDGYYNDPDEALRCFTLHCLHQAVRGGALSIMDPELLLIALYDEDPSLVAELAAEDAMTLPANRDEQGHDRPDRTVPVFAVHADGTLATRLTTRIHNIRWRSDATRSAAEHAIRLINSNPQWHLPVRLEAGQGVVTRNVLHRREAFEDADDRPHRQMLRGRFLQLPEAH